MNDKGLTLYMWVIIVAIVCIMALGACGGGELNQPAPPASESETPVPTETINGNVVRHTLFEERDGPFIYTCIASWLKSSPDTTYEMSCWRQ